jgi:hypothetical protein
MALEEQQGTLTGADSIQVDSGSVSDSQGRPHWYAEVVAAAALQ